VQTRHPTMSIRQAAEFFKIHANTAYRYAKAGRLPGLRRVGRRWLVSVSEVEKFLGLQPGDLSMLLEEDRERSASEARPSGSQVPDGEQNG
jgi:excisionase family DNA binding protein